MIQKRFFKKSKKNFMSTREDFNSPEWKKEKMKKQFNCVSWKIEQLNHILTI